MFYRRFFELAPETRRLFPNDLERQYLTLMDMMAVIIGALDRQELFQSVTTYAGLRHARFSGRNSDIAESTRMTRSGLVVSRWTKSQDDPWSDV